MPDSVTDAWGRIWVSAVFWALTPIIRAYIALDDWSDLSDD